MRTLRIFISSPGDVSQERERASQVIQSLQRRYSRKFHLAPIFWENLPLEPDMFFQQGIDLFLKNPGVDVAVFTLWSMLGSSLGASIRKADGSATVSAGNAPLLTVRRDSTFSFLHCRWPEIRRVVSRT